jgi:hypothetical protein
MRQPALSTLMALGPTDKDGHGRFPREAGRCSGWASWREACCSGLTTRVVSAGAIRTAGAGARPDEATQASKPAPPHGIKIMQQPNEARDSRR